MPIIALLFTALFALTPAAHADVSPVAELQQDWLFGNPNDANGMSPGECRQEIVAEDDIWHAPEYTPADVAELRSWTLLDAPTKTKVNPYDDPDAHLNPAGEVCGMVVQDAIAKTYTLQTFDSVADAHAAGAQVTHGGACGTCSSLQDLAVYIDTPDLTTPVRSCAMRSVFGLNGANKRCLENKVGFTEACSETWYYNTLNTRKECLKTCLSSMKDPFLDEDGSLNACIQCDEDQSGPVFKAVSGRTRRNSGLPSSLCRPADSVWRVDHFYGDESSLTAQSGSADDDLL